jgi:hypothetical protein
VSRDESPDRCTFIKRDGERCRRWKVVGAERCAVHGGRKAVSGTRRHLRAMGLSYSAYLGPTLQSAMEHFMRGTHKEQLQLYEEIALARAGFAESVKLCSAVLDSKEANAAAKQAAASALAAGAEDIGSLVDKMAKIEQAMDDKISVRQVSAFVEQLCEIIHAELKDDQAAAKRLSDAVKDKLKVPSPTLACVRVRAPGAVRVAASAPVQQGKEVAA